MAQISGLDDVRISADHGLDWVRDKGLIIARGNGLVERGDLKLYGAEVTASYQEIEGKNIIQQVEAIGAVKIQNLETEIYGDRAIYHYESDIIIVLGRDLRMINPQGTITAKDSLEYWNGQGIAVARGEATLIQEENIVIAGALTAFFNANTNESVKDEATKEQDTQTQLGQNIERVDATDGVHLSTPSEIVTGQEGIYRVAEQVFRICGQVKITRGDSQLAGECANVDMKTGQSKLEGGAGRVQGLITPQKQ